MKWKVDIEEYGVIFEPKVSLYVNEKLVENLYNLSIEEAKDFKRKLENG